MGNTGLCINTFNSGSYSFIKDYKDFGYLFIGLGSYDRRNTASANANGTSIYTKTVSGTYDNILSFNRYIPKGTAPNISWNGYNCMSGAIFVVDTIELVKYTTDAQYVYNPTSSEKLIVVQEMARDSRDSVTQSISTENMAFQVYRAQSTSQYEDLDYTLITISLIFANAGKSITINNSISATYGADNFKSIAIIRI